MIFSINICVGEANQLLLFFSDARGVGAGTLSSLVRALELSAQESVQTQTSSRTFPPPRSRNFPTGPSRFAPPTSQSKFAPPVKETVTPRRKSLPPFSSPSKPTRFESKASPESLPKRPVATSNSEFRFGSNRPRPSSRITFIPQDRGERFNRPLLPHQAAAGKFSSRPSKPPPPPRTTTTTTTTPAPTPKPVTQTSKLPSDYEYSYDEYYDDYYYYDDKQLANDSEKGENQPEDLGPIDPPMTKADPQSSIPKFSISNIATESTPKHKFTTSSSRTTKPKSRTSSGKYSLSELLLSLSGKRDEAGTPRTSNELQTSRDGRILSQSQANESASSTGKIFSTTARIPEKTTTESRVETRVTNTTESTSVVANIHTSHRISNGQTTSIESTNPFLSTESFLAVDDGSGNESLTKQESNPPSLTSIFGDIDVQFNESSNNPVDQTTFIPRSESTTKVIDITTKAEKLSTTEKSDLPAFLDSIFDKPSALDQSKLPPGFAVTEKVITTTENERTSLAKKLEMSIAATTEKTTSENSKSDELPSSGSKTPSKADILLASLFGNDETASVPSSLLPPGFKVPETGGDMSSQPSKFNVPVGKTNSVPSHLLPKGFISPTASSDDSPPNIPVPEKADSVVARKSPIGLLFPKRINRPSYLTTTQRTTTPYVKPSGPELLRPTFVNIFDR